MSHFASCSITCSRLPIAIPELQNAPHMPCCDALLADTQDVKIPHEDVGL